MSLYDNWKTSDPNSDIEYEPWKKLGMNRFDYQEALELGIIDEEEE